MLEKDQANVSLLGLDERHELPLNDASKDVVSKIGYIDSQIEQMRGVLYRMRVDYLILSDATTETEEQTEEKATKLKNSLKDMRQFVSALNVLCELKSELEA